MRTPTVRSLFRAGAAAGVLALAASGLPAWAADPLECGDQVTSSVIRRGDETVYTTSSAAHLPVPSSFTSKKFRLCPVVR